MAIRPQPAARLNSRATCRALIPALFVAFSLTSRPAAGQIQVGLKLEHSATLRFEPVRVFITIYNNDSRPLIIGAEGTNLQLNAVVETQARDLLKPTRGQPLCSKLHVRAEGQEMIMRQLDGRFDLTDIGRYTIKVQARWQGLIYESNEVTLDVVEGLILETTERHLSGYTDHLRRYTLRYWKRNKVEHLFLRVEEPSRYLTYGVYDLGRVVRVSRPMLRVDQDGKVTVVHQLGKDCFKRSIFQSDRAEVTLVDQSYHLPNGAPYPNLKRIRPNIE